MTPRFDERDIERWAQRGLISAEQRDAILRDLAAQPARAGGLNLTTLLYYSGGLLVLIAYSIFLGLTWDGMDHTARVVISALSIAFFAGVSQVLLRDERFRLPGELLQVVAVAIIPLFVFALLDAAGVWPHDPSRYSANFFYQPASDALRRQYEVDLTWARMGLAGATFAGALLAFRLSRSPFVMIAAIIAVIALFLDVSIQIEGAHVAYTWHTPQALIVAGIGAVVFAAGVAQRGQTERDYSIWLYVAGLAAMAVGLAFKAFPENAPGWGALWMIAALTVLTLSIPLQQRLFAAAGLAAVFAYMAKLVFDVFESATAALVLALLGLLVLGAGMVYQRFSERIFSRAGEPRGT